MKATTLALMTLALLAATAGAADAAETDPVQYQVVTRVDEGPAPTALSPTAAVSPEGSVNENVFIVGERTLNPDTGMLKMGKVQPVGRDNFSAWQLLCDEGGDTYEQSSPNPLTYLTTGISSNLLTQLQRSAEVIGLDIESMKVEAKVYFRYTAPMTKDWAGYTDKVVANVLIESSESPEALSEMKAMAMKGWVAGEGLANKTEIRPELVVNGQHWDEKYSVAGGVPDPVSIDHDLTLSQKTAAPAPETFELGPELDMAHFDDPTEFVVVAVAQSAEDPDRPYLQKIRVRAIQENYASWDLYADDSYGYKGPDKAPTSLDYLTAGTTFCLMSQLTGISWMLHLDIDDYRVEQQIDYRQDNFLTPETAGYTDLLTSKVLVNSQAPHEELEFFFNLAFRCCFAGEAFLNETPIESDLYVNGRVVE